jgi:hypothetical protein
MMPENNAENAKSEAELDLVVACIGAICTGTV